MEATLPGTRPRATYVSLGVAPLEATRTSDTQGHACMEAQCKRTRTQCIFRSRHLHEVRNGSR